MRPSPLPRSLVLRTAKHQSAGHVDQRLLRVHQFLGAIDAAVPDALLLAAVSDVRSLRPAAVVLALRLPVCRLRRRSSTTTPDRFARKIHHPGERIPDPAGLGVANPEIEAFGNEHDRSCGGEGLDAAQHILERAQRPALAAPP